MKIYLTVDLLNFFENKMSLGCFFLVIDQNANILRKAVYVENSEYSNILSDNELIKIRMAHSDKKYVVTPLPEYNFYTFKMEVKEKRKDPVILLGGVLLSKEDRPDVYKDALTMFVEKTIGEKDQSEEDLSNLMEEKYREFFDRPQIILDKKDLEKRLSEKIKKLNLDGNFKKANELLEKMKKIPRKLYAAHESAEKARLREDYSKAVRDYETAQKLAKSLGEKDLVKMYKEKIILTKKTPALIKQRDDEVEKALKGMRKDNFALAQKHFKRAAEVSEKLMDSRHLEEYSLKAKALEHYLKAERKFKK